MAHHPTDTEMTWAQNQIQQYQELRPRYQEFARTFHHLLERATRPLAPDAIVQARAKDIASFAEKILRKRDKYNDPIHQFTDLCGARVITHTADEVRAVSKFIEQHFEVDWENSQDVSQRLKPAEFGYRSVHYIVQFKRGVFPTNEIDETIAEELYGLKAEVQVRTLLEHAWAGFGHDRFYKSAFTIPDKWQRQLAELAAVMENADADFARIEKGLETYEADYGAYLTPKQIDAEIAMLEIVLQADPNNLNLALRIGKLAITREQWDKAIAALDPYADKNAQPILKALGVALTKKYKRTPRNPEFKRGQKYLERASASKYRDADALAAYAGTWKKLNPAKMRDLYRQAFEIDPSDPYAVNMYLQTEIAQRGDVSFVGMMRSSLDNAIVRSREQIDVGINMPWAYFNLGKFLLLRGEPYAALAAYAKGIESSSAAWMVQSSYEAIARLDSLRDKLDGYEWARRLLLLGWAIKAQAAVTQQQEKLTDEKWRADKAEQAVLRKLRRERVDALAQVRAFATKQRAPVREPVMIVAGGTDASVDRQMASYRALLMEAFREFHGTVISGGTRAGVAGLVGDLQKTYPREIHTVGYLPQRKKNMSDARYREFCFTRGNDFSPLDALQYWIDLIASGISPAHVKLLGINGGQIAAAEFRIALALGAIVGVVTGSGRAASKILPDEEWRDMARLQALPTDAMTLRAFIGPRVDPLAQDKREQVAQILHANYRREQAARARKDDPALNDWNDLAETYRHANRHQADHIITEIRQIGCEVYPVADRKIAEMTFTDSEVEKLAEMEHGRWVVERLRNGWKLGDKRDVAKKTSPYLVEWSALTKEVKDWDRNIVQSFPKVLADVGLEVRRTYGANDESKRKESKPKRAGSRRDRASRAGGTRKNKRGH